MTQDMFNLSMPNDGSKTVSMTQRKKTVEGRLWGTLKALAETEGNIYLLTTLKKVGLSTNDVKFFVRKQVCHKKVRQNVDIKVLRSAMQSKVTDACAYAKRLRQNKNIHKNRVLRKYHDNPAKGRRVVAELISKYNATKLNEIESAKKKVNEYKEKDMVEKSLVKAPENTSEILSGVNIFQKDQKILPEEPLGPMVCDPNIALSENEKKLLSRGPKYMVRKELSLEDFTVEMEKMVAKQKFDNAFNGSMGEDDLSEEPVTGKSPAPSEQTNGGLDAKSLDGCEDKLKSFSVKWEENVCNMPFNVKDKTLDLGNLRATQYKHNKTICLPQPEKPNVETLHETRRNEMLRVFGRVAASSKGCVKSVENKGSENPLKPPVHRETNVSSNLTYGECLGLKSLKKRIKEGSIIVCDTDKSKRFSILTKDQYLASGLKHTEKDIEIQPHQVKQIQSVVNDHVWWLKNITNCGANWKHESRMDKNIVDKGEQVCPMVLLIKDHKGWTHESGTPPPSRPVVSGNCGLNSHLSELISLVMEQVTSEANGNEIDSTTEMLYRIERLNEKLEKKANGSYNVEEEQMAEDVCEVVESPPLKIEAVKNSKSLSKTDIRSYGVLGKQTKNQSEAEFREQMLVKVESLRRSRAKDTVLPNLKDRMEASFILDKIENGEAVSLPVSNSVKERKSLKTNRRNIQKSEKLSIIGSDVVSLFPSLQDIETSRLAKHAILNSTVKFENFDFMMGLRYLKIVGGDTLLNKAKLSRLAPRWLGKREDLTTVGGSKSQDPRSWKDTNREIFELDKKRIVATVMEVMINTVMCTHVYSFAGKIFLQCNGGPIGLRSTATLAGLTMKLWDVAFALLLEREQISVDEFFRYVDDVRVFLAPLCEGWRWNGTCFEFSETWKAEDLVSGESDDMRTMKELNKAMSSIVSFLKFESEVAEMYSDRKLPTLDTSLWLEGHRVMFMFYEKPTVPNRVIQKSTALSSEIIRSSTNQGVVRRLLNCSQDLPIVIKQEILSDYAQKLINSGFSIRSSQLTLVHGVTRYMELVESSKLPTSNEKFKPLYYSKHYNKLERKLDKYLARSGWYEDDKKSKSSWRSKLPQGWRGSNPIQKKVPGMKFTTVMQVPSSANSILLKELAKVEPRLAKSSKYQVKLVEQSGRQLSKMFSKDIGNVKCSRLDCIPCKNESVKGSTLCKTKSVVYVCVCNICEAEHKLHPESSHRGKYIGQTSRTLYERSLEHVKSLRNFELDSFMLKHWSIEHKELEKPPKFDFKVVRCHSDPLSRLIHESVKISTDASMNSKSEYIGYKVARLKVEQSKKESIKEIAISDSKDKWEESQMLEVVARSKRLGLFKSCNKSNITNYRKRKMPGPSASDVPPTDATQMPIDALQPTSVPRCVSLDSTKVKSGSKSKKLKRRNTIENVKKWIEATKSLECSENVCDPTASGVPRVESESVKR